VPGSLFELAFNFSGIGFGKRCLSRSGVPHLQPCSADHCLTLQEDCKYLYELKALVAMLDNCPGANHQDIPACLRSGRFRTGLVSQDHYHFGGLCRLCCRRSDSLTKCEKHRITLNHQHRQTRHRKRRGSCQDLAAPAARCCARIST